MAIALVVDAEAQSANNTSVTTAGVNTTGANLIVILAAWEGTGVIAISDSKGNAWTGLTAVQNGTGKASRLYYCLAPVVGTSHTFTVAKVSGNNPYPGIGVQAFSGAGAFDAAAAGAQQSSGSTLQPGSLTPAEDNEVFISGLNTSDVAVTFTIGSSFIETADLGETATSDGVHMAYKIQTTAGAENPVNTSSGGSVARTAVMAAFTAALTGSGSVLPKMMHLHG